MSRWNQDPTFEDVERIAEKLEKAVAKANLALHKLAYLKPGEALEAIAATQAKMLRFDTHTTQRFNEALEEKRVRTLAHGDIVMTCVLSAAVALSEFKRQPQLVPSQRSIRLLTRIQKYSTTSLGLLTFATLTFYTILGVGIGQHASDTRRRSTFRSIRTMGKSGKKD